MPIGGSISPVVEALRRVLDIFHPGQIASRVSEVNKDYLVLSYPDALVPLWNFCKDEGARQDQSAEQGAAESDHGFTEGNIIDWISTGGGESLTRKTLIVIWDGVLEPSTVGSTNAASFVTPYDWLVAFALYQQAASAATKSPHGFDTQVFLIDLTNSFDAGLESRRVIQQFQQMPQPAFPWAKIYHATAGRGSSLGSLLQDVTRRQQSDPSDGISPSVTNRSETNLLRRIWGSRLLVSANPRDHHSIANLLGPHLLISAIAPASAAYRQQNLACLFALLSLVRALSAEPINREQTDRAWNVFSDWASLCKQGIDPVFVLLDDMEELGWSEFLRLSLGLEENDRRLLTFNRPDSPILGCNQDESLLDLLQDENGKLRIRQSIRFHSAANDVVLFLDLRLFSQRTIPEEMRFFTKLLELALQAKDNVPDLGLPWRGFSSRELEAIKRCISQGRVENDDYFLALTMLPRLIALVDPLLPIILFSSTGQRRITEALKGYENIITDFDKPKIVTDQMNEVIAAALYRFERAFTQAVRILKGRSLCRKAQAFSSNRPLPKRPAYVEIYIDEAQNIFQYNFRVGGIALIYDSEQQADDFNQEMINQSLIFGPTDLLPTPQRLIPKRNNDFRMYEKEVYQPINHIVRWLGIQSPVGFCLLAPPELKHNNVASNQHDLTSPWGLDNVYRTLILYLLEVLLFEGALSSHGLRLPSLWLD